MFMKRRTFIKYTSSVTAFYSLATYIRQHLLKQTMDQFYMLCALFIGIYYQTVGGSSCSLVDQGNPDCVCMNVSMTCQEIPRTVPVYIRNVTVTNHVGPLQGAFTGMGWKNVDNLYISGHTKEIIDRDLTGLKNVRQLYFSFKFMTNIDPRAFVDAPRVESLWFVEMNALNMNELFSNLAGVKLLENLIELYIIPSTADNPPQVFFSQFVLNGFLERPLTSLQISYTIVQTYFEAVLKIILKVNVLKVTGSYISWIDTPFPSHLKYGGSNAIPLLKTLDISGSVIPYNNIHAVSKASHKISPFVLNAVIHMEHVYFNSIWRSGGDFIWPNKTFNPHGKVWLRSLHLQRNGIKRMIGALRVNNNSLETFDLSANEIEYISPTCLSTGINLQRLLLSNNRLSEMTTEFPELLAPLQNLAVLYMDNNAISHIPWNTFAKNFRLEMINLADNKLTTVAFDLRNLLALRQLDLSRNSIHFIEGTNLARLTSFVKDRRKQHSLDILLYNNPLQCTCKSLGFIQWLYNFEHSDSSNTCVYEGSNIKIDQTAIEKCQFLCNRTGIIIASSISPVAFIALIIGLVYVFKRLRHRLLAKHREVSFKQKFNSGDLSHEYIAFLAMAGKDEDVALASVLEPLITALKQRLDTHKQVICTGYSFKPGFAIYDEAYRFVKNSCVFVAVVSEAFCESDYCKGELREAYTQQKPIVVVMLGTVPENKMSPYLLEIFRRRARAKLARRESGEFELIPGADILTESILSLAIYGDEDACCSKQGKQALNN